VAFDYDETNPLDSSYIADFPANERAHRTAVVGSANVDHDAEDTGKHDKVTLLPLGADPTPSGSDGFLYTKVIATITELFFMDEGGQVIQLTNDGSASPDKVAIAGDTMTGLLTAEAGVTVEASDLTVNDGDILPTGTALIKLLNTLYLQGRDQDNSNWRDLIGIDGSDVCEVGDGSLGGGTRIYSDGEDELVTEYGSGDQKIYHEGHFDPPIFTGAYESDPIAWTAQATGTDVHGIGSAPLLWAAVIRCISTDLGYPEGAEIPVLNGVQSLDLGDDFNFTVGLQDAATFCWTAPKQGIRLLQQSDGVDRYVDIDKWRLVFYAWY
jgi:hypothetical protein